MHSGHLAGAILVLVLLSGPRFCHADSEHWTDLTVGGDAVGYPQPTGVSAAENPPAWALDQRLEGRFNWVGYPGPNSEVGVQYGLKQRWRFAQDEGSTALADALTVGGADFRWRDLDAELAASDNGDLSLFQNLDRLYGQFYTPAGDITVGRQAISFGLAKVFSPVDVVLPTGIQAQEPDYRPGVDAVRWRVPVGAVNELDLGWVFGDDQLVFGRGYSTLGAWTWEVTALAVNGDDRLIGLGTQTALGDWGLWQELAWLNNDREDGLRWTLGVDQQFLDDVYVVAEYHYNGLGDAGGPYQAYATSDFYRLGMVVPWGRHYVSVQASKPVTPLLDGRVGATVNLNDGSALATASLDWSLTDNSSLDVGLEWPWAAEPHVNDGVPQVSEEFGVYPSRISVNWSTVF